MKVKAVGKKSKVIAAITRPWLSAQFDKLRDALVHDLTGLFANAQLLREQCSKLQDQLRRAVEDAGAFMAERDQLRAQLVNVTRERNELQSTVHEITPQDETLFNQNAQLIEDRRTVTAAHDAKHVALQQLTLDHDRIAGELSAHKRQRVDDNATIAKLAGELANAQGELTLLRGLLKERTAFAERLRRKPPADTPTLSA